VLDWARWIPAYAGMTHQRMLALNLSIRNLMTD